MIRLKRFAIAALAAATIAVGSLATTPTASAEPMSCKAANIVYDIYMLTANAFFGNNTRAYDYWRGRAMGVIEAGC